MFTFEYTSVQYDVMRNDQRCRFSVVVVGADLPCAPLIEDLCSLYTPGEGSLTITFAQGKETVTEILSNVWHGLIFQIHNI